ncbi:MAG: HAD family phosphatase [Anaerolineae bacterium]|nr:HAD family phosphatase [Anaerolineae bacterium]
MTKAIIWDMDGVLADTGEAHLRAWQVLYGERGQTITREEFAETFGMANGPIIRGWLGEATPDGEVAEIAARKEALYRELLRGQVEPLPGVLTWLEHARGLGLRQIVASSTEMANIIAVIGELGIGNFFDALISGAFLPRSKPDPGLFLQAAATVGAEPSGCLVIEDAIVGVEAARRAGMRCIAVTTSHSADKLSAADTVVDSLGDLPPAAMERLLDL